VFFPSDKPYTSPIRRFKDIIEKLILYNRFIDNNFKNCKLKQSRYFQWFVDLPFSMEILPVRRFCLSFAHAFPQWKIWMNRTGKYCVME